MNEKLDKDVKAVMKIYDGMKLPRSEQFSIVRQSYKKGAWYSIVLINPDFLDQEIPYSGKDSPKFCEFKEKLQAHFLARMDNVYYSSQMNNVVAVISIFQHPKKPK